MSNANKILLNARVRRLDGTVTYINKVNANGYSTDAKGPQIPVKRIVVAGKSLKEIEAPFEKGEHVIVQGVAVKLNKSQQRAFAAGELKEKDLRPDFGGITFVNRDDGKATDGKKAKAKAPKADADVKATKSRKAESKAKPNSLVAQVDAVIADATNITKRADAAKAFGMLWKDVKAEGGEGVVAALGKKTVRRALKALDAAKSELAESVDTIDERKTPKNTLIDRLDAAIAEATTKARRKLLSEAFDMDWKDIKKHGGAGIVKHAGKKSAQRITDKMDVSVSNETFIKQMPTELKRLIQGESIKLNQAQIEKLVAMFGLDTKYYAIAVQTFLGNLSLVSEARPVIEGKVERPVIEGKVEKKKKKAKAGKPEYASEKEEKRRLKKLKATLIAPSKKEMKAAKKHQKQAKAEIADALGITAKEVKRGLIVYRPDGTDLMFIACDATGPVFVDKAGEAMLIAYANVASSCNFTLKPTSELDAAV